MKTYIKTIQAPKLVISYDENAESPRHDSNLGYFITVDRNYHSPDKNKQLERIVKETGELASSQAEHMDMIKRSIDGEMNESVIAIYPVTKYEHSGVSYSLGTAHGFDNSNNGFYIVTDKTLKEVGTPKEKFVEVIKAELETYTSWVNGEVYLFELYDDQGKLEDSCSGFYSLDEIREYLPDEWKDEKLTDYLQ